MAMTIDEAQAIKREPVEIGKSYTFYSTSLEGVASDGSLLYLHTGRPVLVIGRVDDSHNDEECEPLYLANVGDGATFDAYEGELNGWYKDTGQFHGPDGRYGVE